MNLSVFNLKYLKRHHINLVILSIIFFLLAIAVVGMDLIPDTVKTTYKSVNKIFFFLLVVVTLIWSGFTRKKLKTIKALEDKDQKIREYEKFHKFRMWGSAITFLVIDISWIFTQGNYMFYFLILMLVMQLVTYPGKRFVAAELMDEEIIIE